ncbi:MAG: C69 family dipeptidase [Phycisphaerae bacterium]|nr:C69 family dipeptidase [Phycisphaerae bacterium]
MCDTIVVVRDGSVLLAKNSDREINEAQILEWHPRRTYPHGASVQCTWITIPQVRQTFATLLSRPFWCWGAEMGANEHGVAIGNEAVFTNQPYAKTGLTGMDLIRLALERAETARQACDVVTALLETHGQGGGCGMDHRRFTYHNSFILADPTRAFVLETAGRHWAVDEVTSGARTISNALTIPAFAAKHAERIKTWGGCGAIRQRRTQTLADDATGPADLMAILRDHGEDHDHPAYSFLIGGMQAPCAHAGGIAAAYQTTASWVSELRPNGSTHWVTATAAPCTALFKPVRVDDPVDLAPTPTDKADDASLWWRHERLHRMVMKDPDWLRPVFAPQRDETEERWLRSPPSGQEAFAEGDSLLQRWTQAVASRSPKDNRPLWVRRLWNKHSRRAGLAPHPPA